MGLHSGTFHAVVDAPERKDSDACVRGVFQGHHRIVHHRGRRKRVLDVEGFAGAEISGVRIYNSKFSAITNDDVVKEADVKLVDSVIERRK
jgi:hypothetical protein